MFMKSAKRGSPRSSANRLPWAPARTSAPDFDSGSMARNALFVPGLTGNSMTVATDGSSEAGVPMEQATPSGPATSASKNVPRL